MWSKFILFWYCDFLCIKFLFSAVKTYSKFLNKNEALHSVFEQKQNHLMLRFFKHWCCSRNNMPEHISTWPLNNNFFSCWKRLSSCKTQFEVPDLKLIFPDQNKRTRGHRALKITRSKSTNETYCSRLFFLASFDIFSTCQVLAKTCIYIDKCKKWHDQSSESVLIRLAIWRAQYWCWLGVKCGYAA